MLLCKRSRLPLAAVLGTALLLLLLLLLLNLHFSNMTVTRWGARGDNMCSGQVAQRL